MGVLVLVGQHTLTPRLENAAGLDARLLTPPCLIRWQGKLQLIFSAILAAGIIAQQRKQLPQDYLPLGHDVQRPNGSITYLDGYVEKRVVGPDAEALQPRLGELQQLYAAAAGCEYLVHAQEGPRMTALGEYVVCTEPVGWCISSSSPPEGPQEMRDAIR